MITLSDVINAIEAKKELSDSSKKNYCDYLKNFSNGLKATDMKKMFMDFEKFDKFLKAKSNKANSLKSWFTAINAIFKIYPKLQIPEAIVKKYFDEMMKYSASSKTAAKQNIPAPNQVDKDDNIIPWSKIVDLNKLFTGDKLGLKRSDETKKKIGESSKLRVGSLNPNYGVKWKLINNGINNKKIKEEHLQEWLDNNWSLGWIK